MTVAEDTEQGPDGTPAGGAAGPRAGASRRRYRRPRSAPPSSPGRPAPDDGPSRRRAPRSFVLLRMVDADTPVHRLWAGTKLLGAVGVSLTVSIVPSWAAIGVLAAFLVAASLLAGVPGRAVPRPPGWFWVLIGVGAVLTILSGGRPEVTVAGAHVGFGGLLLYVKFTLVSVVLLGAGALIGWTTSLGDIGPAVGRLLRPFTVVRLPVEEWATAIALCIRSLPLIVEGTRILIAARRLRPKPPGRQGVLGGVDEAGDLLVAVLSVSLRRAAEMAEAMTARGGTSSITARAARPGRRDAVALAVIAGVCSAGWLLPG